MFDLQQDKCVSRQHCMLYEGTKLPELNSVTLSPDDRLFYMATNRGSVGVYDIQAAKIKEEHCIPNQSFTKITVDPSNKFVFVASISGKLHKFDTG